MIQFTDSEIKTFRESEERGRAVELLSSLSSSFLSHKLMIPDSSVSNWSHYYYCPDCSVQLVFDPEEEHDHVCPSCKKHFSDELKDGAWWRLRNTFNENGAYYLGLLYMLTGDVDYARKAKPVLLGYAERYPEYQVHGDIPYNGPGKLNAQTLDEANFLRNLGYVYDLIETTLSEDEKSFIKKNLFQEGISFLRANRHSQIHNHEVICNGAIGVLALILSDKDSLSFALDQKYGLKYQLKHGLLEDGFWFECSTAYHFYALQNFLLYEKFARHTEYSNLSDPLYRKMILSVLRIRKSDDSFPLLNDCHPEQGLPDGYSLMEFAYSTWKDDGILAILHDIYTRKERFSLESFFYGVKELPERKTEERLGNLKASDGLGASIIRRGDVYFLLRHGPYGGEHDHYDRLGFSYYYRNVPVSIDIGTTGYGARLHYAYYKRTATHNTITINEGNQAPSCGELLSFDERKDSVTVRARVRWTDGYVLPDSFTILQWDEEAYRNAEMVRTVTVTDSFIITVMECALPEQRKTVDYITHFHGKMTKSDETAEAEALSSEEPLSLLSSFRAFKGSLLATEYENSGIVTDVYTYASSGRIYTAEGFDNPSNRMMNYVLARTDRKKSVFVTVMASHGVDEKRKVKSVGVREEDGCIIVDVHADGKTEEYRYREEI